MSCARNADFIMEKKFPFKKKLLSQRRKHLHKSTMKRKSDPRHQKRIRFMQELFSWQYESKQKKFSNLKSIVDNLGQIDKLIEGAAPDRPLNQINRIDLAILRLAVFELIIVCKEPPKAIIDEAVEIGKEYGSDSSSSFINGVLGKVINLKKIEVKNG